MGTLKSSSRNGLKDFVRPAVVLTGLINGDVTVTSLANADVVIVVCF